LPAGAGGLGLAGGALAPLVGVLLACILMNEARAEATADSGAAGGAAEGAAGALGWEEEDDDVVATDDDDDDAADEADVEGRGAAAGGGGGGGVVVGAITEDRCWKVVEEDGEIAGLAADDVDVDEGDEEAGGG